MRAHPYTRAIVLSIVAAGAIGNLVVFASMYGSAPLPGLGFLFIAWQGALGAQVVLHGIWSVLAPVGAIRRLVWSVVVALAWYGAWVLARWTTGDLALRADYRTAIVIPFCLPLIAIMTQTPVWLMCAWRGWQVVKDDTPYERQPFTTHDIIAATVFVGLSLAAVQFGEALQRDAMQLMNETELVRRVFTLGLGCIGLSAITAPPIVWATLRPESPTRRLCWVVTVDLVVFAVAMAVPTVITGRTPDWFMIVTPLVTLAGFRISLTGVMLAARGCGYRLVTARDPLPSSPFAPDNSGPNDGNHDDTGPDNAS